MSMTIPTNPALLHKIIELCQAELALSGNSHTATKTKTKTTKNSDKPKRQSQGTAWADFVAKTKLEKKSELDAYIADRIAKATAGTLFYTADQDAVKLGRVNAGDPIPVKQANVGAHFSWMSAYKKANEEEWKAFEAEWQQTHSKVSAISLPDGSIIDDEPLGSLPKARGRKKKSDMTPAELAKHEAAVASRAASKKAKDVVSVESTYVELAPKITETVATTVTESSSDDDDSNLEHHVFMIGSKKYMRLGSEDEDGNVEWYSGDLWYNIKGSKGDYYGCLQEDGSVDTDADEPLVC